MAYCHVGIACVLHGGLHIGKVKVDVALNCYKLCNSLYAHLEYVIRKGECLAHGKLLLLCLQKLLIGDNDKGIHVLLELCDALLGNAHLCGTLKFKGLGDNSHGEYAHFLSHLCHDGSRTCTCAAAHACCDEHHIRACKSSLYLISVFLCALSAHIGPGTCALAPCELYAYLHPVIRTGGVQCPCIGIDDHIFHADYAFIHHSVDGISAAAADTYDPYYFIQSACIVIKTDCHDTSSCYM